MEVLVKPEDPLSTLPPELFQRIVQYIPTKDLVCLSHASKCMFIDLAPILTLREPVQTAVHAFVKRKRRFPITMTFRPYTAVHWAAHNDNVKLLNYFLSLGVSIRTPAHSRQLRLPDGRRVCHDGAPLHYAAMGNAVEVAKILLDTGAKILDLCPHQDVPILRAAARGNVEIVRLLLSYGQTWQPLFWDVPSPLEAALKGPRNSRTLEVAQILLMADEPLQAVIEDYPAGMCLDCRVACAASLRPWAMREGGPTDWCLFLVWLAHGYVKTSNGRDVVLQAEILMVVQDGVLWVVGNTSPR
ncbi:hypothetical protein FN846DRAFT_966025 [Sphaerosporella brunnea]|uniref:F-box domain-containing protein n=1 Tax=Sphaerosporella brunnea TaxID=1250544 RepID=A0A5J5ELV8_9PEZI|nr:hypothetical protein FN846DRAFT_966025 [Sphaerosporella brunnea]